MPAEQTAMMNGGFPSDGTDGKSGSPTTAAATPVPSDVAGLKEALAQRDTTLLRREGENFLLAAQVQQLKRANSKACESASTLAAQLAQVLQGTDSGGSAKVGSRTRAALVSVHRGLQRLASGEASGGSDSSRAQSGRPPRDVNGDAHDAQESFEEVGGADRASRQAQQQQNVDRRNARLAKEQYEKERQRRLDLEAKAKAQAGALAAEERRCRMLQSERDRHVDEAEALKRQLKELRASNSEMEQLNIDIRAQLSSTEQACSNGSASARRPAPRPTSETTQASYAQLDRETLLRELENYQTCFLKQRELLMHILRRSAAIEDEKTTLGDDVTRRNVIIHKLREDLHQQQRTAQDQITQLTQVQQQQQQQQQQLSAQHQQQQLQQLQRMHKLQSLLMAQQQQQHQLSAQQRGTNPAVVVDTRGGARDISPIRPEDELESEGTGQIVHDRTVQQLIEEIQRRDCEISSLKAYVRDTVGDDQVSTAPQSVNSPNVLEVTLRPDREPPLATSGDVLVWAGRHSTPP
jgi:hypothetical protein